MASIVAPSAITGVGVVKDYFVRGRLVHMRVRDPADPTMASQQQPKAGGKQKGKGTNKGKAKGKEPEVVVEVHISGGQSPANVIKFEAWAKDATRLRSQLQDGQMVDVTKCRIMAHTPKTWPWTTSRIPFYLRATPETVVQSAEEVLSIPRYHPLSSIEDLHHLPSKTLVCVAGRVVPPDPTVRKVDKDQQTFEVGNAHLRAGDHWISLAGYREHAAWVQELTVGDCVMLDRVYTHLEQTDESGKTVQLRVGILSRTSKCTGMLAEEIASTTPESLDGANALSKKFTSRTKIQWADEDADWVSLSVVGAVLAPGARRDVSMRCKIPSVFLQLPEPKVTYHGCSVCKKGDGETGTRQCDCKDAQLVPLLKTRLTLMDSFAQVTATCFDAFQNVIEWYAAGDPGKQGLAYYEEEDNVEVLRAEIAAVPFTVLLSFEDSDYIDGIELVVRLITPTFDAAAGVHHPMCPVVWVRTSSMGCPPCALQTTSFRPGLGMSMIPGGATSMFRVLLEILDGPSAPRRGESAGSLKVSRRCVCALRTDEATAGFELVQHGPAELVFRFLALPKNTYIHAHVSWRAPDSLCLSAFWSLPAEMVAKFRVVFRKEVQLFVAAATDDKAVLTVDPNETPLRIAGRASTLSATSTGRQSWASRQPIHLEEDQSGLGE